MNRQQLFSIKTLIQLYTFLGLVALALGGGGGFAVTLPLRHYYPYWALWQPILPGLVWALAVAGFAFWLTRPFPITVHE